MYREGIGVGHPEPNFGGIAREPMSELTWDTLWQIRKILERGWDEDTAYEAYEGKLGDPTGQCYVSCLVAFLLLEDHNPAVIRGDVGRGDNDHFWLEIEGKIIDLTADQFGEFDLPPIVWGEYEEYPNYKPVSRDSGFQRFLKLARRTTQLESLLEPTRSPA